MNEIANIVEMSSSELEFVNGGVTSNQVRDVGNAAAAVAGAAAVTGSVPVAAAAASVALHAYAIAFLMDNL